MKTFLWIWAVVATLYALMVRYTFTQEHLDNTHLRVDTIWLYCSAEKPSEFCRPYADAVLRMDDAAIRSNSERILEQAKKSADDSRKVILYAAKHGQ